MLLDYTLGQTSIVLRVKLRRADTGLALTGLTSSSTGLVISTIADNEATATAYTVAGSNVEAVTTLGTFATPTASKCRFKEVDATNHPGIYELQIANARYAVSSAKSLLISISGASNLADADALIPLRSYNPYDAVRLGLTCLPNVAQGTSGSVALGNASGNPTVGGYATNQDPATLLLVTPANKIATDSSNRVTANTTQLAGQTVTAAAGVTFPTSVASPTNITAGTITTVTTLTNAPSDSSGVTTLLSRVTAARAGYLDNLNVGGLVASHSDITSLDTATPLATLTTSPTYIIPSSGSTSFPIFLYTRNLAGALTNVDSGTAGITAVVTNGAGTDRSANLGTWTAVSTGIYQNSYTVSNAASSEPLILRFSGAIGGNAFAVPATPEVTTAANYTATSDSHLTAIYNWLPTYTPSVDSGGAVKLQATQSYNNTGQTTKQAATLAASDFTGTIPANATQWGGTSVTGMPLPTTSYTSPPSSGTIATAVAASILATPANLLVTDSSGRVTVADKTGYSLASSGLDSVVTENGWNARQAIAMVVDFHFGQRSGLPIASGGNVTVKNASGTSRGTITLDTSGNVTAVNLTPPA